MRFVCLVHQLIPSSLDFQSQEILSFRCNSAAPYAPALRSQGISRAVTPISQQTFVGSPHFVCSPFPRLNRSALFPSSTQGRERFNWLQLGHFARGRSAVAGPFPIPAARYGVQPQIIHAIDCHAFNCHAMPRKSLCQIIFNESSTECRWKLCPCPPPG